MMKRVLSNAALLATLLATSSTIGAQQTYDVAYDIYYYPFAGENHFSDRVGYRHAECDTVNGGVISYMVWGYTSAYEDWVEVDRCPNEVD